jgi:hypothetical protein
MRRQFDVVQMALYLRTVLCPYFFDRIFDWEWISQDDEGVRARQPGTGPRNVNGPDSHPTCRCRHHRFHGLH